MLRTTVQLGNTTSAEFANMYADEVSEALDELTQHNPPSPDVLTGMKDASMAVFGLHLKKDVFSAQSTGIAIAGFGSDDQFPSLYVYDSEGIIAGRVKRGLTEQVDIHPLKERGYIAALAQDDVVKRYVEGIDPRLSRRLEDDLRDSMRGFGIGLAQQWFKGKRRKDAQEHAAEAADKVVESFLQEVVEQAKNEEKEEIANVVNQMSKSDLAQLAEALVEMTALRRRVSLRTETVGGPVDVAVISRGDGFVWVKRKHYFDPKLNSRYFVNQRLGLETRRHPDEG